MAKKSSRKARSPAPSDLASALSLADVARECSLNLRTVQRLVERGELEALRVGGRFKVTREQLDAWLARTVAPAKRHKR